MQRYCEAAADHYGRPEARTRGRTVNASIGVEPTGTFNNKSFALIVLRLSVTLFSFKALGAQGRQPLVVHWLLCPSVFVSLAVYSRMQLAHSTGLLTSLLN